MHHFEWREVFNDASLWGWGAAAANLWMMHHSDALLREGALGC
jgi:hypothetical protein